MVTTIEKSYDPYFFERLFTIEDRHFWFRGRNEIIRNLTSRLFSNFSKPASFLEVGCGTGVVIKTLTECFPQMNVFGMDLFLEGLRLASKRTPTPLLQADLHHPPFSCKFDIIGLFDVLEHLSEDEQVLKALGQMLTPEGYIILTVPASKSLWSYFDVASCHVRRYELEDLRKKITDAGLTAEYISHYMMTLYPLVVLKRLLFSQNNVKTATQQEMNNMAEDELNIVPIVNEILLSCLRIENRWIQHGRHIPWGTSLIAIARNKGS